MVLAEHRRSKSVSLVVSYILWSYSMFQVFLYHFLSELYTKRLLNIKVAMMKTKNIHSHSIKRVWSLYPAGKNHDDSPAMLWPRSDTKADGEARRLVKSWSPVNVPEARAEELPSAADASH